MKMNQMLRSLSLLRRGANVIMQQSNQVFSSKNIYPDIHNLVNMIDSKGVDGEKSSVN